MSLRTNRTFQAIILAGLGLFFLDMIWTGSLVFYTNQRFVVLILLAGLGFLGLAQGVLNGRPKPGREETPSIDSGNNPVVGGKVGEPSAGNWISLLLVIIPIVIGLVIPVRALGAGALPVRGVSFSAVLSNSEAIIDSALSLPSEDRNVLDWIRAFSSVSDPNTLIGQPVDVTGFVYHGPRMGKDEFVIVRYALTCCVVDAAALGLAVEWPKASELVDNDWVRIQGSFQVTILGGNKVPLIQATTIDSLPAPEQPYLSP